MRSDPPPPASTTAPMWGRDAGGKPLRNDPSKHALLQYGPKRQRRSPLERPPSFLATAIRRGETVYRTFRPDARHGESGPETRVNRTDFRSRARIPCAGGTVEAASPRRDSRDTAETRVSERKYFHPFAQVRSCGRNAVSRTLHNTHAEACARETTYVAHKFSAIIEICGNGGPRDGNAGELRFSTPQNFTFR